jgi:hypothetical protein
MIHACNVQTLLKTVTGTTIQHFGKKTVNMWLGSDKMVESEITFEVTNVKQPVLSLGLILSRGAQLVMNGSSGYLAHKGRQADVIDADGVLYMRARRLDVSGGGAATLRTSSPCCLSEAVVASLRVESASSSNNDPVPPEHPSVAVPVAEAETVRERGEGEGSTPQARTAEERAPEIAAGELPIGDVLMSPALDPGQQEAAYRARYQGDDVRDREGVQRQCRFGERERGRSECSHLRCLCFLR